MSVPTHPLYVMSQVHPTVEPEQHRTDTFAVFRDNTQFHGNLELIARVEVPRYAVPSDDGSELSRDQRLQMAVQFAVTDDGAYIGSLEDPFVPEDDLSNVEGEQFMVTDDLDDAMELAAFQRNPAVAGCWNPNEESVEEYHKD